MKLQSLCMYWLYVKYSELSPLIKIKKIYATNHQKCKKI